MNDIDEFQKVVNEINNLKQDIWNIIENDKWSVDTKIHNDLKVNVDNLKEITLSVYYGSCSMGVRHKGFVCETIDFCNLISEKLIEKYVPQDTMTILKEIKCVNNNFIRFKDTLRVFELFEKRRK